MAHQVAPRAAHHAHVVDEVHVDVAQARVGREEDDEEDEAHDHRHFRGQPDAEPHDEQRRQRNARRGVEDDDQRMKETGEEWKEREDHADEHAAHDADGEADHRLLHGRPDMRIDEAAREPAGHRLGQPRRAAHEVRIDHAGARAQLPRDDDRREQQRAADRQAQALRGASRGRSSPGLHRAGPSRSARRAA